MKKIVILIVAILFAADIFAGLLTNKNAREIAIDGNNGFYFPNDNLLGKWVMFDGAKENGSDIEITFLPDGLGKTGFNFLYLDTVVAPKTDIDGDIRLFIPHETRFFWTVAREDFVTNGKGEMLEYAVIKIWFPPKSELVSINVLSLGDEKIAIFGENGKMFFFSRPRTEV